MLYLPATNITLVGTIFLFIFHMTDYKSFYNIIYNYININIKVQKLIIILNLFEERQ